MGDGCWFWRPITPKVGWAGGAGSWWDGSVEELKKAGLRCDVALTAQKVCPLFVPNLLSSHSTEQDPCSQEHWPPLACTCPAFWSWLTAYSAPWL